MYNEGVLIYMTIYTSLTEIGWVINEEGEDASLHAIRFGAMVLNEQQQGYAQVKREFLGYCFCGKAKQRLPNRDEGHDKGIFPSNPRDDIKVCNTKLEHANVYFMRQINELGNSSNSEKEQSHGRHAIEGKV